MDEKDLQEQEQLNNTNEQGLNETSPFSNDNFTFGGNKEHFIYNDYTNENNKVAEQNIFNVPSWDILGQDYVKQEKEKEYEYIQKASNLSEDQKKDIWQFNNIKYGFINGFNNKIKLLQKLENEDRKKAKAFMYTIGIPYYITRGIANFLGGTLKSIEYALDGIIGQETDANSPFNKILDWGSGNTLYTKNPTTEFEHFKNALYKLEHENKWAIHNIYKNVFTTIGEMAPLIATAALMGGTNIGANLAALAINAPSLYGRALKQGEDVGLNDEQLLKYGLTQTISETIIEGIGGIGGIIPIGKIASKLGGKLATNTAFKAAKEIGLGAIGEAFEEFLGGFIPDVDYFKDKQNGKERKFIQNPFNSETLYSMFIAGIVGGLGSVSGINADIKNEQINTSLENAKSLHYDFILNAKKYGLDNATKILQSKLDYKAHLLNNNKYLYFLNTNLDTNQVKFDRIRTNIKDVNLTNELINKQNLNGILEYDTNLGKVKIVDNIVEALHNKFNNTIDGKAIINNEYAINPYTFNKKLDNDIVPFSKMTEEQKAFFNDIKLSKIPLALTYGPTRTKGGVVYLNINETKTNTPKVLIHEVAHNLIDTNKNFKEHITNLIQGVYNSKNINHDIINKLNAIKNEQYEFYKNNDKLANHYTLQEQGAYLMQELFNLKNIKTITSDVNLFNATNNILDNTLNYYKYNSNIKQDTKLKGKIKRIQLEYNKAFTNDSLKYMFELNNNNNTYFKNRIPNTNLDSIEQFNKEKISQEQFKNYLDNKFKNPYNIAEVLTTDALSNSLNTNLKQEQLNYFKDKIKQYLKDHPFNLNKELKADKNIKVDKQTQKNAVIMRLTQYFDTVKQFNNDNDIFLNCYIDLLTDFELAQDIKTKYINFLFKLTEHIIDTKKNLFVRALKGFQKNTDIPKAFQTVLDYFNNLGGELIPSEFLEKFKHLLSNEFISYYNTHLINNNSAKTINKAKVIDTNSPKLNNDNLLTLYNELTALERKFKDIKIKNKLQLKVEQIFNNFTLNTNAEALNYNLIELHNSLNALSNELFTNKDYQLDIFTLNNIKAYLNNIATIIFEDNNFYSEDITLYLNSLFRELVGHHKTLLDNNLSIKDYHDIALKKALSYNGKTLNENILYATLSTPQDVFKSYSNLMPNSFFSDYETLYHKSANDALLFKKQLEKVHLDYKHKGDALKQIHKVLDDNKSLYNLKGVELTKGKDIKGFTASELIMLKLSLMRDISENTSHLLENQSFYLKRKNENYTFKIQADRFTLLNQINKALNGIDKNIIDYFNDINNVAYHNANNVFKAIYGFDMNKSQIYIPFYVEYEGKEIKQLVNNIQNNQAFGFINTGFTIPITDNASRLTIANVAKVINNHIYNVENYIAYERLIVEYVRQFYFKNDGGLSLKEIYLGKGIKFSNYIEKTLFPSLLNNFYSNNYIDKTLNTLTNIIRASAFASIAFNPSTLLKQNISIFNIGIKDNVNLLNPKLLATFLKGKVQSYFKKGSYSYLMDNSLAFWNRVNNFSTNELKLAKNKFMDNKLARIRNKIVEVGTYFISKEDSAILQGYFDVYTTILQKEHNITIDEARKLALLKLEHTMRNSLASVETMYKTPLKNSKNPFYQLLSLMQGENQMQVSGILNAIRQVKSGVKGSKNYLVRTLTAFVSSSILSALVDKMFSTIRGYDDELNNKQTALDFIVNKLLLNNLLGSIPLVNALTSLVELNNGENFTTSFYSSSLDLLAPPKNLLRSFISFVNMTTKKEWRGQTALTFIKNLSSFLGIPLKNLIRIIETSNNILSKSGIEYMVNLNNWFKKRTDKKALKIALLKGDNKIVEHYLKGADNIVRDNLVKLYFEKPNFMIDPNNLTDNSIKFLVKLFNDPIYQVADKDSKISMVRKVINKFKSISN